MLAALLVFAAGALAGGWRPGSSTPEVYTFGPDGDITAFVLFDGQCAAGRLGQGASFGATTDAPCGTPHDLEVIGATTPLDESRDVVYPGEAAMAEFGRSFCGLVFDSGQVRDASGGVDKSDLRVAAIVPGPAVFADTNSELAGASGSRLVSCVITRADGEPLPDRFSVI